MGNYNFEIVETSFSSFENWGSMTSSGPFSMSIGSFQMKKIEPLETQMGSHLFKTSIRSKIPSLHFENGPLEVIDPQKSFRKISQKIEKSKKIRKILKKHWKIEKSVAKKWHFWLIFSTPKSRIFQNLKISDLSIFRFFGRKNPQISLESLLRSLPTFGFFSKSFQFFSTLKINVSSRD